MTPTEQKPVLKPVTGGKLRRYPIGNINLVVGPYDDPPFKVGAILREEDTWRVLASDSLLHDEKAHNVRLLTDLIFDHPARPGTVITGRDYWSAVVCDLERDPPCAEHWVMQAMETALRIAGERRLGALAIPLLGNRHGGLPWHRSLRLIVRELARVPEASPLHRIWLQVNAEQQTSVRQLLLSKIVPEPRGDAG